VLRFALELLPALGLGLLLGRAFPWLPGRLAGPLIQWGVPISLTGLLLQAGLRPGLLVSGAMALAGTVLGLLLLRRWLPSGSLQLGSVTGNTAYWGLPVAVALLPAAAIGHAITYDLVGTLITWAIGPLLVEGLPARWGALLAALRTSPASRGLVVAVLVQLTPWSAAVASLLWWPARIVLLVALAVVGMRLGVMLRQSRPLASSGVAAALAIKLVLFPALMLAACLVLRLPALVREAVVLQAAAPTAISVLLLAEARPGAADADGAAALVLGGTLLALGTVPLWWGLLARVSAAG
jgi:predicted permease